jgi:hypothetical protein
MLRGLRTFAILAKSTEPQGVFREILKGGQQRRIKLEKNARLAIL